ncbi:hypothetical protein [Pseudomonas sp. GW531-T4]|uniref:hypothetical protein n=1 Tax=Pseudomonas sp. GW531-T4 TaxID=2075553 RepID=UPI000CD27387|nr:hypothetical protein [Pseudomonas sp. GW531-T4]POA74909.1 hypothetical protein C1888_03035 [Pseudomonas sp. GW531-T4]
MDTHVHQRLQEILKRLANAVLPLEQLLLDAQSQKPRPPPPNGSLIPPVQTLPWRPSGGAATLAPVADAAMAFFDDLFERDSSNEHVASRWLMLRTNPLTHFLPAQGTTSAWRTGRNLSPSARFGAFEGESVNSPYTETLPDGSKVPVSRQVFYAACWEPLMEVVYGWNQSVGAVDLNKVDWTALAAQMLGDGPTNIWPLTSRVSSREFIRRFAVDLLVACLGQRNVVLEQRGAPWGRAVLIEVAENRHVGNTFSLDDVAAAVATLESKLGVKPVPAGANGGQP